jgi:threonine synthase
MNEGLTSSFAKLKNLKNKYDLKSIYIKDETRNPTASFKDRPTSVGISKALELGYRIVTIASSGNGAAATAGYAAKAGVKSHVFVPENTPESKINQILTYGAEIIKVKGVYSNSYKLALEATKKFNWANLTSTYLNPYTLEGDKTVAYELFYQIEGEVPDYIFVPIGAGPLLYGIFKGFKELNILGLCNKIPAMVGVQAEKCSPIISAYKQNKKYVVAWEKTDTIKDKIVLMITGHGLKQSITSLINANKIPVIEPSIEQLKSNLNLQ